MAKVYRVTVLESERGWSSETWTRDFESQGEAQAYWDDLVNRYGGHDHAPDFYMMPQKLEVIEI